MRTNKTRTYKLFLLLALVLFCCDRASATTFTALDVFGDSTVDSGWWKGALNGQCGVAAAPCTSGDAIFDSKVKDAIAAGGTGAPVGVGLMNTQILATMLGIAAPLLPANQPGGTNYAISGSKDAVSGGLGNLHSNPKLPSTVQQIANYLAQNGGVASATALYLISSGGNDITYANQTFNTLAAKESYLSTQIATLVGAIKSLQTSGAQNFLVHDLYATGPNTTLVDFYNQTLNADLAAAHVNAKIADVESLVKTVEANPTAYGFTDATVMPGVPGSSTGSACVAGPGASGWGQFCGNTTMPQANFSHLRSADSEQTSFFSDDQHFSAAGQLIEADFDFNLLEGGVPEPSTWAMLLIGFAGLGVAAYRRKSKPGLTAA
jgi:outer membrane lipase/esterase